MTVQEVLFDEFEKMKAELIAEYDKKGMRASGKWAESLENASKEKQGVLLGLKYSEQLQFGRKPTKSSTRSQPTLREAIEQWVIDKGIIPKIPISSFAFIVARKIHKEGWNRNLTGGVNLITDVVTDARIDEIVKKCGDIYTKEFISDILKLLQNDTNFATAS
jgi:hypothetical protein